MAHTQSSRDSFNEHPDQAKPWFKQRWLLFLISVPLASVILSSIMVTVAVKGKDSLVKDNYYKYGMEINQTIYQDKTATKLGLSPTLTIQESGIVTLAFDKSGLEPQPFVKININHPTLASKDVSAKLLPAATGYFAEIPQGLSGRYYVDIYAFDDAWRIREEVILPADNYVMTSAIKDQ